MCIRNEDHISRCIVFHKAAKSGIHVDAVLFVFTDAPHESGVLRRLAAEDTEVHRIGCSIARIQNARKNNPPPGPRRRYYCGFRTACVSDMVLMSDDYQIVLSLQEEGGEVSHVDFAIVVHTTDRNARATIKAEAGLSLAESFGPAVAYVCEEDRDDSQHPLHLDPFCLQRGFPTFVQPRLIG